MNYKDIYKQKGVVVIPNVFTHEECDRIREEAYRVNDDDIKKAGYKHQPSEKIYNRKSLIFFPSLCNEYLNQIRTDDRLANLVRDFVGGDVRQVNNQVYFREAGDKDQFAWHQDIMFREDSIFNEFVEEDYFQTIIAVDDIKEDNGAIEFIEGSHLGNIIDPTSDLRKFDRNNLNGVKYTATKGSVLMWSVMIIHGSEPNQSNSNRMTYMNGFCRERAAKSYPLYMKNNIVLQNIDPTQIP